MAQQAQVNKKVYFQIIALKLSCSDEISVRGEKALMLLFHKL